MLESYYTHYLLMSGNFSNTARDMAVKQNEGKTIMYTAYGSEWRQFGNPRKPRPLNSVVLDEGISERILTDVEDFMNNPEWYSNRGKIFVYVDGNGEVNI